jgi:hypothetical protein
MDRVDRLRGRRAVSFSDFFKPAEQQIMLPLIFKKITEEISRNEKLGAFPRRLSHGDSAFFLVGVLFNDVPESLQILGTKRDLLFLDAINDELLHAPMHCGIMCNDLHHQSKKRVLGLILNFPRHLHGFILDRLPLPKLLNQILPVGFVLFLSHRLIPWFPDVLQRFECMLLPIAQSLGASKEHQRAAMSQLSSGF